MSELFDIDGRPYAYPPEAVTPALIPGPVYYSPPGYDLEPGSRCYVCADVFDSREAPARTLKDGLSLCEDCMWVLKSGI